MQNLSTPYQIANGFLPWLYFLRKMVSGEYAQTIKNLAKPLLKAISFYHLSTKLDALDRKKYFSFLNGFSGYNQIKISLEDQDKTTFTCLSETYYYRFLPFGVCNAPTTFQRVVLVIFSDLIHECVEVSMNDFATYGNTFEEALVKLEIFLFRCRESNLELSNEK